ncbi:hypothetical protein ABB37_09813 [Leptomonas pyrrhocoris]|uniref:Uncharacterized protein n=1 Tax=Leptomonas pyrrhocoris TaxID=157538 RepID=A0A0N0VCR9_LEPPY|nr:hypothetical protein ABB37_09813 [Leptomonas pyrrhocoris]XP_015651934.1 hypothetical protein ABB37_09813 [Leptomonas pyrrhocoris]KPA73494.1 hypothetical protein ABB37_09813 [Leptomonas pyrrhocoris]KPA73495.1 hypothetical protein ABB37_09813 [Leptomonas pyrrhocoris]|eukprot:XP_015651933.1 hypothetical protein ABB37_09813 [Leptomonas pyrrhocoris]
MTENAIAHRPSSRQGSPVPHRQLGTLSVNQRSYSRMSSKGVFGDDSPLMSPLPYYPRHRSVTFAEGRSGAREERPNYNGTYSASALVSPVRQLSPPPVSILKTNSSFPDEDDSGAAPAAQVAAATVSAVPRHKDPLRRSPVPPTRGRSNSRQRLAARRREAQLHHSFYDDSFVEEFVLSAKTELEKEEAEQRRVEEQLRAEQEKAKRAERRVSEATEKINALQHAKEVLMAATVRRHASVTPSPPRARADKSKRNSSLLRELEDDPDPAVQEALKELSRQSTLKQQRQQGPPQQHRRRSMPIVSEDALAGNDVEEGAGEEEGSNEARKRARLEKIVSSLLSRKGKSKSKRSVMVIDWSDIDSDDDHNEDIGGAESQEEEEEEEEQARPIGNKRQRSRQAKSRSAGLVPEATLVPPNKAPRKPSARRAASANKRTASVVPDLGDSLLFEAEEQPILLPRRQHQRPAPTRSISHIDMEEDDDDVLDHDEASVERIVRRAPRATRAPATRQRRGPAVAGRGNAAASFVSAAAGRGRRAQAVEETEEATTPAPAPPPRRAAALRADPNDPMAVFFEAAFPSPSKFDEMMMQAGGLPETRRGGGGGGAGGRGPGRQPNLVLPSSIGRRR